MPFPAERYHRGKGLLHFEQSRDGVVAHFADGSTAHGEVLVGADGLRSTVRQQCLPDLAPLYAGYVAWRALLPESVIPPAIHREMFMNSCRSACRRANNASAIRLPDRTMICGPAIGASTWCGIGRPTEASELPWLLTDDSGVTHAISIPPPLIRREAIAQMRAAAERLVAWQLRDIVRLIDEPILQPIYDLETPRMAFGRVAIIGDAAFVARPHVAAGVSKAADDAAALADALAVDEVEPALRQFEAARLPVGFRIIERARHLGAYLQATQTAEERARSARHSIPEAVLAETAMLDFLQH